LINLSNFILVHFMFVSKPLKLSVYSLFFEWSRKFSAIRGAPSLRKTLKTCPVSFFYRHKVNCVSKNRPSHARLPRTFALSSSLLYADAQTRRLLTTGQPVTIWKRNIRSMMTWKVKFFLTSTQLFFHLSNLIKIINLIFMEILTIKIFF